MNTNITTTILTCAREKFKITALKPYQLLIIQRILEQEDPKIEVKNQLVILPTGTGKSLCFLIPAFLCENKTIIVYPLLALMNDQISKLKKANIDSVCLRGGQTKGQRDKAFEKIRTGTKIIITNPETLSQKKVLNRLKSFKFSLFVCDEAHVISQWGKDFRPQYGKLGEIIDSLKPRQVLSFTATAGKETINDIKKVLFKTEPLLVRGDSDRENVYYSAYPSNDRTFSVLQILKKCQKPAIVFCPTRKITFELCRTSLRTLRDFPSMYYNAGLSKEEREAVEEWFLNSNDGVLFSTTAYGMGIDKPNIRTVIHYCPPSSVEAFLQESGRAGRDFKQSFSYVIITSADKNSYNTVSRIFTSDCCRRKLLLKEMEQEKEECSGCDVCNNSVIKEPPENRIIKKSLLFHRSYKPGKLASILCGNRNVSFVEPSERLNPFFGIFKDFDEEVVKKSVEEIKKAAHK